ncbi:WcbI family polysaccharide biosynthesis putative acetyltransferase [Shimia marina]|uniref:Polysaccharide biosynthesis enzyme WcbI domain-containing protein n=1 Tax=Shimia marina TaxID=321267 RepID=A0A0P1ES52_9RHOB|nr:WcbI family polysaccharide biosynthesis putative acetyltransferase [Shimia marina]CUH53338.1 hypothetical protein SHM7688_02792 [Shimia marina]SFD79431.1 hypothetical protein SAMN04488037_102479 [Shimia marina]
MMKLLSITNCQGPALFWRFLKPGAADFDARFHFLRPIQVHLLTAQDAENAAKVIDEADVIVAQPIVRSPVDAVKYDNLKALCATQGKQLFTIPALHFSGQFALERTCVWDNAYPFGRTEDEALVRLFAAGASVEEAARFYHEEPLMSRAELLAQMDRAVDEFRTREESFDYDIAMSGFYSDNWRKARLHHVKAHPTAYVYRDLSIKVAEMLGLNDFDLARAEGALGNNQFELPLKRWVMDALDMEFEQRDDVALFHNEAIPFTQLIETLWQYYETQGREAVERSLPQEILNV